MRGREGEREGPGGRILADREADVEVEVERLGAGGGARSLVLVPAVRRT